jgi:hypothetical protein
MKKDFKFCLAAVIMAVSSQQASAINLQFDYTFDTNNFFNTQDKKDVLNAAGTFFNNIIQDDLTAIASSGLNHFTAKFKNPGTGSEMTIDNFNVAADTLIVYAGGRALAGTTLGVGGPGGFGVGGTTAYVDNAITRGQTSNKDGVQGPTATDFAPWGGSITFNTGTSWYFDPDVTTSGDIVNNDFFSVALHELGHLLGIGTADSWSNLISGLDFTGAASSSVFGENVPLENTAHWKEGTTGLVNGVSQEAAMDPSIAAGTRKVFTDLDLAGLTDIGWEVTAVPVPAAIWLFGSGLIGLVITARRR